MMRWVALASLLCIGVTGNANTAKPKVDVTVEELKLSVKNDDTTDNQNVAVFAKAAKPLSLNAESIFTATFSIKNKADGSTFQPHQVFIIFEHVETSDEITFAATLEKSGTYKAEVNFAKSADSFGGHSGKYRVHFVAGDVNIKFALYWVVADATITVPEAGAEWVRKSERISYAVLPELEHTFRQPDKRPPGVVSDAFTVICLLPLLVLFALWGRIGINFGNLPASIYVPIFHVGLAGLFALYVVFWLQLNMFDTLKYMAVIGTVTFIAGNRLLKTLAAQNKPKKE